jgi:formylglycine-generating enzyme required for sulfatase activity
MPDPDASKRMVTMRIKYIALMLFVLSECVVYSGDVAIQSYDQSGQIEFNEIPEAIRYRVEWSATLENGWNTFSGTNGQWLDDIPASGSGIVTATVPMFYRVVATIPPPGMVFIPSGTFSMGQATNVFPDDEIDVDALPLHVVQLDGYFISKHEVTRDLWNSIFGPAVTGYGYSFSNMVVQYPSTRPKTEVSWYDAIKWCNARSEVEGLKPVYYTDGMLTNVYRFGTVDPIVDWTANGYRLPTEAEWEKASRGGVADTRFPWSDFTNKISLAKANYYAGFFVYDLSFGYHPDFQNSGFLAPVGYFPPNDYGIYDMAGNAFEWCWDWYASDYYETSPTANPKGPASGSERILRGGGVFQEANYARCSARYLFSPEYELLEFGFRCVRRF